MTDLIFLGNGPLADFTRAALAPHFHIVFHAKTAADLAHVAELRQQNPHLPAVLASFGVLIKKDLLDLFEPEGILNLHPSLLPAFRGASPIESAIKSGQTTLGISIMKLGAKMDAGPIYYQESLDFSPLLDPYKTASEALGQKDDPNPGQDHPGQNHPSQGSIPDAAAIKSTIYRTLAEAGAKWLINNLSHLPTPTPQNDAKATFCGKFDKTLSPLAPSTKTAAELHREIIAHAIYPRSKITLGGHEVIVLSAHIAGPEESPILSLRAADGQILSLDRVQPAGKRPMDAKAFKNGYLR